jgi:hypothetical protein
MRSPFPLEDTWSTLLLITLSFATITAAPLQNITIPLPPGSSDRGSPGILCTPTKWTDIVVFFLANYVAHAAMTRSLPGEQTGKFMAAVLGALIFPASGTYRGILAILTFAKLGKSDLQIAARAGALCIVVRGPDWKPRDGDTLPNAVVSYLNKPNEPGVSDKEPKEQSKNSISGRSTLCGVGVTVGEEAEEGVELVVYKGPWIPLFDSV